jgi:hypothetical protein
VTKINSTDNTATRLTNLPEVTSSYGVHFTREGQKNLADNCIACLRSIIERSAVSATNKHKSLDSSGVALRARLRLELQEQRVMDGKGAIPASCLANRLRAISGAAASRCDRTTHNGDKFIVSFQYCNNVIT